MCLQVKIAKALTIPILLHFLRHSLVRMGTGTGLYITQALVRQNASHIYFRIRRVVLLGDLHIGFPRGHAKKC